MWATRQYVWRAVHLHHHVTFVCFCRFVLPCIMGFVEQLPGLAFKDVGSGQAVRAWGSLGSLQSRVSTVLSSRVQSYALCQSMLSA